MAAPEPYTHSLDPVKTMTAQQTSCNPSVCSVVLWNRRVVEARLVPPPGEEGRRVLPGTDDGHGVVVDDVHMEDLAPVGNDHLRPHGAELGEAELDVERHDPVPHVPLPAE